MQKNQKGFSAIEGLLILVIVGVVGFVGWYVWHSKNNADNIYNSVSSSTTSTNPYAGWKTYTSAAAGLSFKYPSGWHLINTPCPATPTSAQSNDCVSITSPQRKGSDFEYVITYMDNVPNVGPGQSYIIKIVPLNIATSKVPLGLVIPSNNNLISSMGVEDITNLKENSTVSDLLPVASPKHSGVYFSLGGGMVDTKKQAPGFSLSQYQSQPDYNNVVKIFESLNFN